MPRYFTLEQAQQLLPEVEAQLRKAIEAHKRNQELEAEQKQLVQRVAMSGGMRLDPARSGSLKNRREQSMTDLRESVEAITELGVQIKDLDIGLVDFPTRYRGQEVLLCWRLGETGIRYWHDLEAGFRGRKKIDREFVDHHQGDDAQ